MRKGFESKRPLLRVTTCAGSSGIRLFALQIFEVPLSWLADYSHVDMLGSQYKLVNFGAESLW